MSDLTDMTADDFQAIAEQFAYFASVYKNIADEVRTKNLGSLEVKGVPTLNYAIERINGSVGSAQKSLMVRRKVNSRPADMVAEPKEQLTIENQASEANRKARSRRKKEAD